MAYERLNLPNGIIMNADHMKHIEDGIVSAENQANNLGTSKQDKLSGKAGQVVGFDASGNAVAQDAPEGGGSVVPTVEPAEDDIPKVFFGKALPHGKSDTVMSFRYISKTKDISGWCITKAQGNSSMGYPKKNQTVKLYSDAACTEKLKVNFKGWGEQYKFCFKANWIDTLHVRNIVSARLWGDIVRSRSNYASSPAELQSSPNQGAVDGFPIKLYAGGVYQGRYTINIPKDAWMANMDDSLDTHCILCGENYESGCFRAPAIIDETDWTDEIHDTVPESILTRWNECISFVMNSTDEEFRANIGNYFDLTSLLDYHLFGLASCGVDAYGKNQLYMTWDGQKWYACMYDMDATWGAIWDGSQFKGYDFPRESYEDFNWVAATGTNREGNLLYVRIYELMLDALLVRWGELKNGPLSIDNIINRFERFTDICPPWLIEEDYASTTANGAFVNMPSKDTNTIQRLREFATKRIEWVTSYLTGVSEYFTWSSEHKYSINNKGEEGSGSGYITPYVVVDPKMQGNFTIKNVAGATYNYLLVAQYDTDMQKIDRFEGNAAGDRVTVVIDGDTRYVRLVAPYNSNASNNNPSEQIAIEFDNGDWTSKTSFSLDPAGLGVAASNSNTRKYISGYLKTEGYKKITVANVGNASFEWPAVFEYTETGAFIKKSEVSSGTLNVTLQANTAKIRVSVDTGGVSTNNNPGEQISITFA